MAVNPEHFGSDPADIRIHIRINHEILIRIPDNVGLTFRPRRSLLSLNAPVIIIIIRPIR